LGRLDRCTDAPASSDCPAPEAHAGAGGIGTAGDATALGGSGAAGNLGEGGAAEAGASSVAGAGGVENGTPPTLVLLYADHSAADNEPSSASRAIRPNFSIENRGDETVSLSELKLRYYYTLEAASTQTFLCDFVHKDAVVNDCDGVKASFGNLSAEQAKNYVEISFEPPAGADWQLTPLGGTSGVLQLRFYNGNFAPQDQTNDYSFDPTKVDTPEEWSHVTLYRGDELVYGTEPL
jgi:hypothetical protein